MAAAMTAIPGSSSGITVRNPVTIAGTGFAATAPVTITLFHVYQSMDITWTVTTDASGNWSLPGKFVPQVPGWYTITGTDGTSTITSRLQVYAGV